MNKGKLFIHKKIRRHIISGIVALAMTLLVSSGVLYFTDNLFADALYQRGSAPDPNIVVIGIDSYSLKEIGEWPWDRSVMAQVLEELNQDAENKPAVIGLDIVYSGTTTPESDRALAEAAGAGNVVAACTVEFSNNLVLEADGTAYMNEFSTIHPSYPYDALREQVQLGHVNAMYDKDGILRHHLWEITLEDGTILDSLPKTLYQSYCSAMGLEATFKPAVNSRGFWWVDFTGEPGDYYGYSVADLLNQEYDPEVLRDAVVLIGPYESTMSDDFITAVDHAQKMYGVEYLANVLSNAIQNNRKKEVSVNFQYLGLFMISYCMMYFFLYNSMLRLVISYVVSMLCTIGIDLVLYYQLGYVLHPLWVPFIGFLYFISCVIIHYSTIVLEKRNITRIFHRYVDGDIINELLKEGTDSLGLKGKTVDIAVLFVDIRGFTTLSEQLKPEEVVEILNEYLSLTSSCIKQEKGTLDKYVGDCTMAFWGAPLQCEDPVYHACQAAIAMKQGATKLTEDIKERFHVSLQFGIGVHFGPAVVGNIGSPQRMDYTAIGDTVNTSSRLEANAPAGTIYISRAVADILGDRGQMVSLGNSIRLKGKKEDFEIIRLDGLD